MITLEIKANTTLVAYLNIVNMCREHALGKEEDEHQCMYSYRYMKLDTGKVTEGEVSHYRKDGIEELMLLVLEKMQGEAHPSLLSDYRRLLERHKKLLSATSMSQLKRLKIQSEEGLD
ncbi:MAG: hypothetical protein ACYTEQ_01800 [Planctomycetota bacterium]